MLDYFYTGRYEIPEWEAMLAWHLEVWVLAGRYGVSALGEESKRLFCEGCEGGEWEVGDFLRAVRFVEQNDLVDVQDLRGVIVRTMRMYLERLMRSPEFGDVLGECKGLNLELVGSLRDEVRGSGEWTRVGKKGGRRNGRGGRAAVRRWSSPEGVSRR